MPKTEYKLSYTVNEKTSGNAVVIIVCGGNSTRMNGKDKMLLEINGVPTFIRSIKAFEKNENVGRIIVVSRAENLLLTQQLIDKFSVSKVSDVVAGGKTRQDSVKCGFERVGEDCKILLVHDGARPLVTNECINRVIEGAARFGAVSCAVKCKDTIKKIDSDGKVIETPNRASLVSVQTPQGFKKEIYSDALSKTKDLSLFTDDCSVVENAGYPVYVVDGDYENIKITTPNDVRIAEELLKEIDL